jgi:chromosome segregation protein
MRIRELQLYGFKSFPHKTTVRLSPGLSAIVGPNGCGKSNILDALRWVLGEQSFSLLRCTRNEDVIFGGTSSAPALGYAEVRLILENLDGAGGVAANLGSEVELRRRYFRSGESEYFLNRNPCRLKDIQDLFFDSGTGTKSYSIFDQRTLRTIFAGELRAMFDEAATLAKYRERKSDCLRKLELTDADLLRLNDIVAERERVTRSLKRQAYRLSAFDRLKNEEKRLQLILLKRQYDEARTAERTAQAELAVSETSDAELLGRIREQEAAREALRRELAQAHELREQGRGELEQLRTRLSRIDNQRAVGASDLERFAREQEQLQGARAQLEAELAERAQLQETNRQAREELQRQEAGLAMNLDAARMGTRDHESRLLELRNAQDQEKGVVRATREQRVEIQRTSLALEAQIANAQEYRARLTEDLESLEARVAQAGGELAQRESELARAAEALDRVRTTMRERRRRQAELGSRAAQLNPQISGLHEDLLKASNSLAMLQPLLSKSRREAAAGVLGGSLLGAVSDFLTVHEGCEPAVEAVLLGWLDYLVVTADAIPELTKLDRNESWEFIAERQTNHQDTKAPRNQEIYGAANVSGSLAEHVELKPGAPRLVRELLRQAVLVDSLDQALAERRKAKSEFEDSIRVTRDGIAVFPNGTIVLASTGQGRLTVERQARELEARVTNSKNRLAASEAELAQLNRESLQLTEVIAAGEIELVESANNRSGLDAARNSLTSSLTELESNRARQRSEVSTIAAKLVGMQAQQESTAARVGECDAAIAQAETRIAQLEREIATLEQSVKTGLQDASEALLRLTQVREQMKGRQRELELVQQEFEQTSARLREGAVQRLALEHETVARREQLEQLSGEATLVQARLGECSSRLAALDLSSLTAREETLQREIQGSRQQAESARQRTLDLKLRALEAGHRREEIEHEATRAYATALGEFTSEPEPELDNKLRLIRERLDRLGRVNPLAGEDFQREQTELDRLTTQRADVLAAKENLLKTITEIDRFARDQFVNTFDLVRDSFREIFARLFVEGEADLILETPDRPLESEITVIAKPKGKMPKRLDQLSDGEKALLGVSLLFAFYRVKPAPFCFLDEVDAPLDDANVDRFALFLKELADKTQVVIITHNRATVEQAEALIGVTAEEPGVSKIVAVKLSEYRADRRPLIPRPE